MNYRNETIDELYSLITSISSVEECANLFEDLCTIKEIQDMSQRLKAAKLLSEGVNYQQISQQLGLSSATIARVNHCLTYGSGGYQKAVEKLSQSKDK